MESIRNVDFMEVVKIFSEDTLLGKIQRLMLLGYDSEEISKKLSKAEWEIKRHMSFLRNSVEEEMRKRNRWKLDYNKEIAEVFERVFHLEGVKSCHGEDVAIHGGHCDDYLLVGLLSRLINEDVVDIVIKDNISERNLDYLQRLLHLKERGDLNAST